MAPFTNKQIEVAVEWWKDVVRGRKKADHAAGEISTSCYMAFAEALGGKPNPLPEAKIEEFGKQLEVRLVTMEVRSFRHRIIETDYNPDVALRDSMAAAGITGMNAILPPKMRMWLLEDGRVQIRPGDGAAHEDIYVPAVLSE